jgi:cytoskeletal protein RodZ
MESIGQRFKTAREKKRVSLSQAALKTHIKVQHLEAMERGDFSKMPAPIYARGFIRTYAGFLGIDPIPLVKEYDAGLGGATRPPAPPISSKIIKTAPGEQPLPTATVADIAAESLPPEAQQTAPANPEPSAPVLDSRLLATAGVIIGAIILTAAVIKLWPSGGGSEPPRESSAVIEVSRPSGRSPAELTREPPEPYIEIPSGGRTP